MRKLFYFLSQVITTQFPVRRQGEMRVTYEINPGLVHTMGERRVERPALRNILRRSYWPRFEV